MVIQHVGEDVVEMKLLEMEDEGFVSVGLDTYTGYQLSRLQLVTSISVKSHRCHHICSARTTSVGQPLG